MHKKNKYGQYFTPTEIAEFMVSLSNASTSSKVLEPSCGEGVFIDMLKKNGYNNICAYEIDKSLGKKFDFIKYESFVSTVIKDKYDLIIGNPPYIRMKNLESELRDELNKNTLWNTYFNSLCDYLYIFILKSIELLIDNGELIFICPEYWLNTTHSITLRNYMIENGNFEKIFHFNETPIFSKANVSIIIFKYRKTQNSANNIKLVKYFERKKLDRKVLSDLVNENSTNQNILSFDIPPFEKNKRWILANKSDLKKIKLFEKSCIDNEPNDLNLFNSTKTNNIANVGDICDIGNGLVSGLDKAFQINGTQLNEKEKKHTIQVVKAKNLEPYIYKKSTSYIFINDIENEKILKQSFPNFYKQLVNFKEKLSGRYNYNREIKYWHWVFLRNFNLFNSDNPRIFVPCKERISNKDYFRFSFIEQGFFPTQDVTAIFPKNKTKESIFYILSFLNNHRVFNWLKNKGIIKGNIVEFSEKPISSIPFRKIDWNNDFEVKQHNKISTLTKEYISQKRLIILDEINGCFDKLLD